MFANFRSIKGTAALVALVAFLLPAGSSEAAGAMDIPRDLSSARPIVLAQAGYDPGISYLSASQMSQYSRVGRISVQLVQKGSSTEVPFERPFRTGDEFRFQITTNKDGWLYVLHRSPGGQFQVLYPQAKPGTGQSAGTSRVVKNQHYLVPQPGEGTFVFDADTGTETFYLVIKDRPEPPSLNDVVVSGGQPASQAQGGYSEQPYQAPSTAPATQYPPPSQGMGTQYYEQPYQAPSAGPATQYPAQQAGAGGGYYEQPYQAQPSAPASPYPQQSPGAAGQYYEQPYQAPPSAPASQYPPQAPSSGGTQYQQQYQAPATTPAAPYPAQPQTPGGQYYQQPYPAAAAPQAAQASPPQMDKAKAELKQNVKMLALNALNYSIIPRSTTKAPGLKYRGVRFKPESPGSDPGTYFAPQQDSELQDAWFVFQLSHTR